MGAWGWVLFAVAGFLCGSIPWGVIIARAKGIDLRAHGSGNIGATNVGRVLGGKWFGVCLALDAMKGFAPTLAAGFWAGVVGRVAPTLNESLAWLGVALASILGHVFSPWLGFKGGKGVATSAGALLAVVPTLTIAAIVAIVVFVVALRRWRYMSVASIVAACALPLGAVLAIALARATGWRAGSWPNLLLAGAPFVGIATLIAVLVAWTHRANIGRLRAGTEPRWSSSRSVTPEARR